MKLYRIRIERFKSIEEVDLTVSNLHALVGANNAGKSNILEALSITLGATYPVINEPGQDYFHKRETGNNVKIFLTFGDMSETDLRYFRGGDRRVVRERGGESPGRTNHARTLNVCLEIDYENGSSFYYVGEDYNPISFPSGDVKRIKRKERDRFPKVLLIPSQRDPKKYFSDTSRYQWGRILNEARKRITDNAAINQKFEDLMDEISSNGEIEDINSSISDIVLDLLPDDHQSSNINILPADPGDLLAHAELVIDDGFESALNTKGDGVQGLAVVALLLYASQYDENLLIALEEPELYLHPLGLYILNASMQKRSINNQVIYASHSPFLVNVNKPRNIIRVYKENDATRAVQAQPDSRWLKPGGEDEIERDIDAQRNMLFFANCVVLVEGPTENLSLPQFAATMDRNLAKSGVALVEVNGKANLPRYSDYMNAFNIPHIIVYDQDSEGLSLNESIENSYAQATFMMSHDFEEMMVDQISEEGLEEFLRESYGATYGRSMEHFANNELDIRGKHIKFLRNSKPFACRYMASSLTEDEIPKTIKEIIDTSIRIASGETVEG